MFSQRTLYRGGMFILIRIIGQTWEFCNGLGSTDKINDETDDEGTCLMKAEVTYGELA